MILPLLMGFSFDLNSKCCNSAIYTYVCCIYPCIICNRFHKMLSRHQTAPYQDILKSFDFLFFPGFLTLFSSVSNFLSVLRLIIDVFPSSLSPPVSSSIVSSFPSSDCSKTIKLLQPICTEPFSKNKIVD